MAKKNWLGSEVGMVLKTVTIKSTETAETINGRKIIKSGSMITDENLGKGLLFNDVDITDGDRVASIMIRGTYIDANLPKSLTDSAEELAKQGLYAIKYAETTVSYGKVGGEE